MSDIAVALRRQGEFPSLRGCVSDIGSFPVHKLAILRLYLKGLLIPGIARRTCHTPPAWYRCIRCSERVQRLATRVTRVQSPLLAGMSARLIEEYATRLDEPGGSVTEEDAIASSACRLRSAPGSIAKRVLRVAGAISRAPLGSRRATVVMAATAWSVDR